MDKSGKKFAPKAPTRRPVAATPLQTSVRSNTDRSSTSQTPSHAQQLANSLASAPLQTPNPNAVAATPEAGTQQLDDVASQNRLGEHGDTGEDASIRPGSPNQTDSARITTSSNPTEAVSQPTLLKETDRHAPESLVNDVQGRSGPLPRLSPQPPASSFTQNVQLEIVHEDAPAAKRRKVTYDESEEDSGQQQTSDTQGLVSSPPASDANINTAATSNIVSTNDTGEKPFLSTQSIPKPSRKGSRAQRAEAEAAAIVADATRQSARRTKDAQKSAKVRKPRQATSAKNKQRLQDAATEIVADAVEGATARRKGRRGRKERQPTPEEAENEIIEPARIKMADLCKDTRKGKKSDILKALQERDKEEFARKKQKELQQLVDTGEPPDPGGQKHSADAAPSEGHSSLVVEGASERQEDVVRQVAGTYVDEHGQIMIDTGSLQVNRHAQAAAEREQNQEEAVVENDLSRPAVNSMTHAKREKQNSWPEEMTDEFYEALRMFGTDFGMISKMLRKTRRAVKLKFTREEKQDPDRIKEALLGERIPVDLDDYSRRAGEDIKELEEHERTMEEDRKEIEEHAADELRAKEEQDRLRNEEAEREHAAVPDDSSGKENHEAGKKKEKGRKAREKRIEKKQGGKKGREKGKEVNDVH
ncbi:MAG: hypothetical protein Q9179_007652 [Wetmoreana sp. 5 TL-2023]